MDKRKLIGSLFFALIAEMDLVVKNLINIFFLSRYLGEEGAAAYEVFMPCLMLAGAVIAMGYNGVQAICAKDYGAGDLQSFERHKNAGYSWLLILMGVLTLVLALFKTPVLDMLGANDGSEALALLSEECYSVSLTFFVPQVIFSIGCCLLFFEEKKKLIPPNLILYSVLIGGSVFVTKSGPSMTGYMLVTLIAMLAADLYLILSCFIFGRKTSKAAMTAFLPHFKDFRDSFFTGLPDSVEYVFAGIGYLIENIYLLHRFSESLVAGITVFEAIDNVPETLCVGFCFLVTASLGTRVGQRLGASSDTEILKAEEELASSAKRLAGGAAFGGLAVAALLAVLARPLVGLFMPGGNPEAVNSAVLLIFSCSIGFVFYLFNSEIVSYFKIVGAYTPAHLFFFADAMLFPLGFKILLGELFGVTGYCFGIAAGHIAALLLNLCIVRVTQKRFPHRLSDFRMDSYLNRLIANHKELDHEE